MSAAFSIDLPGSGFSAATRLYRLDTPLGPDRLLVECWSGREALSSLTVWQVVCLATDVHIELKSLIAREVILHTRLPDGSLAQRSGWVAEIAQLGADGGFARYRLTLVPWLWLATQRRNSRVFQDKTVLEIVEALFAADGARAHWRLAPEVESFLARVRPRSYCCQYRESDYAFLSRLLAEEGIGFYFEEVAEPERSLSHQRLVLFTDSTAFAEEASAAAQGGIRFHRAHAAEQQDAIQVFGSERRLQPAVTSVATRDYRAARVLAGSLPTAHRYAGPNAPRVEAYDWAGLYAFARADEMEHYLRLLREAADARFKTWFGQGNVRSFRAGTAFALTDSPLDLLPGLGGDAARRRFSLLGVMHAGVNNLDTGLREAVLHHLGPAELDAPQGDLPLPDFGMVDDGMHEGGMSEEGDTGDIARSAAWVELLEAARADGYANRFTAIRADIPWRPALYDGAAILNPRPTVAGSQTAIVVGPDGSTANAGTVHTDHLGRVRIRFHWQRDGGSSWVRVLQPYAGAGYGAQFIPRIGQEVLVGFFDNDIDRPYVSAVLYNGQGERDDAAYANAGDHAPAGQGNRIGNGASPAWHGDAGQHRHSGFLSGFKSVALGSDGYARQANELVFDDSTGRLRTRLASDTAATQLSLGHLIHQADNYRGSFRGTGWELRTDAYGALRAGKGLLLTTSHGTAPGGQPEAAGDNAAGIALLRQAKGFADTFDRAATLHQTVQFILVKGRRLNGDAAQSRIDHERAPLDAMLKAVSGLVDAQDGSPDAQGRAIPHMHQPLVVVTARPGIDIAAADGLHVAAGEAVYAGSGRDTHVAVGEAMSVHAGQALGLLAGAVGPGEDGSGIKLYAGAGDVDIQAQSGEMTLAAQDVLELLSTQSHVDLAAAKSIEICTEGGASLKIEGGNITFACPGTLTMHAGSKAFSGPTNLAYEMNDFPGASRFDEEFILRWPFDQTPVGNRRFEIVRGDGSTIRGKTDAAGKTGLQKSDFLEALTVRLLPET